MSESRRNECRIFRWLLPPVVLLAAPCALALISQAITGFSPATPIVYGPGTTITLSAAGGGSGNPVVFASTTAAVCTVAGNVASLRGAGTCTLTANQAGNATYAAASQVKKNVVVNKASQTIAFGALPGRSMGSPPFALSATTSSGLAVAFKSSTTGVCTISGATVNLLKAGTCSIAASQAGDGNYSAAVSVTQSFAVYTGLPPQAITGFAPATPITYSAGLTFTLSAIGGASGNAVIFSTTTGALCSVAGKIVSVLAAGTCTLKADQAGNASYAAAPQVSANVVVNKSAQTIAFDAVPNSALNQSPVAIRATASSGLAVVVASATTTICTVAGTMVTLIKAGTCTLRANQAGNANYNSATQVSRSFTIQAVASWARIDKPANNATFEAPATIPFTYTTFVPPGVTLVRIDVYQNNALINSITPGTGLILRNVPIGNYSYRLALTDSNGVTGTSPPVAVTVTPISQPVVVGLARQTPGSNLDAPAQMWLDATATARTLGATIAKVEFYSGTTLLGTSTAPPYTFNWSGVATGRYSLTAVATDSTGATGMSPALSVVVDGADTCDALSLGASAGEKSLAVPSRIPLSFEENAGQSDPSVRLLAHGPGFRFFLTDQERTIALRPPADASDAKKDSPHKAVAVRMRYIGAGRNPVLAGEDRLEQQSNYLVGDDPTQWRTGIAHFARARYSGIYPGIDEVHYGEPGHLESDLIVAPGANPDAIRLAIDGVDAISLDQNGDLVLRTAHGTLLQKKPLAYQEIDGRRQEVAARYRIEPDLAVTFALGDYDPSRTLVIDPVLTYATLLGGSDRGTHGYAIAVSRCGEAFVAGSTFASDFPTTAGAFNPTGPHGSAAMGFVSKLNRSGSGHVYSTYLTSASGTGDTAALALAVDGDGRAIVAGTTHATDFPVTPGVPFPVKQVGFGFLTKLNKDGSAPVYSTYLPNDTPIEAVTVTGAGTVYFAFDNNVWSFRPDGTSGDTMALVDRLHEPKTTIQSMAADSAGNLYLAGITSSANLFVTDGAFQTTNPAADPSRSKSGFVMRLGFADGSSYLTYLGATSNTEIFGIAIDAAGSAYVTGEVGGGGTVPNLNGPFTTFNANVDHPSNTYAFVAKLNPAGSQLSYFSRFGGANCQGGQCAGARTWGNGIAVDSTGRAWIAGPTRSNQIPLVDPLVSSFNANLPDLFAARLDATGTNLEFSTVLGGQTPIAGAPNAFDVPGAVGIAVDWPGAAYVAGNTNFGDFPTTPGAFKTMLEPGAGSNAFVVKIGDADANAPPTVAITAPADGASVAAPGPVTLASSATASAGRTIVSVGYYHGGTLIGTAVSPPYAFTWSGVAVGTHLLTAMATDSAGNRGTSTPITVMVTGPQTGAPSAPALISGVAGPASATLTFTAPVSNGGSAITGYSGKCAASGQPLATATAAAAATVIVVSGMAGGVAYTCSVTAANSLGASPASNSINVTPLAAPSVAITSPTANAVVGVNSNVDVLVVAVASPKTIARIEIFDGPTQLVNFVPTGAPSGFNLKFGWRPTSLGAHALTARMTDSANTVTTSSAVNVSLVHAPTVKLGVNGRFFLAPADIDLYPAASSPNGSITRLELMNGANVIATITAPPYTYRWRDVASGTYALSARATDSAGMSTTSTAVNVKVGSAMSVAVDAGVDGRTVDDDSISFGGTLEAPVNSAVNVNGRLAVVTDEGRFFFNSFPLAGGPNTLAITVTDIEGRSAAQTISVNSAGQAPFVFRANNPTGFPPLATSFTLTNRGGVAFGRIELSCNDDGTVDRTFTSVAEVASVACSFGAPGTARARITVYGPGTAGPVIFTDTQTMFEASVAVADRMLRGVYADMLDKLKASSIDSALRRVSAGASDTFAEIWNALGADIASVVDELGAITSGTISDEFAEYALMRSGADGARVFMIHLLLGGDGIWRIDGM